MPRWLRRLFRMGCIGTGATMITSAVVNLIAIDRLVDETFEEQLGVTTGDLKGFAIALGITGLVFVLLGALLPLGQKRSGKPKAMR